MLTRKQIKEALAEKDEKYTTDEIKREAVVYSFSPSMKASEIDRNG